MLYIWLWSLMSHLARKACRFSFIVYSLSNLLFDVYFSLPFSILPLYTYPFSLFIVLATGNMSKMPSAIHFRQGPPFWSYEQALA
ncbi:hypothetical protein RchiOBHm_Chr2g0128131 [Rosa chinensis]|uniref:Uncharacterized protein n=1 Tax=Rosa chinensis TaxID=74649 RepID=A0A2P6RU91_ROSCH|nr:hypothetical protein RchiOBHm_Chr2g0128131 [Rosa chinensis]